MSEEEITDTDYSDYAEYYSSLNTFYSDRLKSSLKRKFNKCNGCKNNREFIVKDGECIYTCGSDKGECSEQFKIQLAKYIDYQQMKSEMSEYKDRTMDFTAIKDLINVQKEIEEYDEFRGHTKDLLKNTQKTYIKQNDLKKRKKEIENYHAEKVKILVEQNKLNKAIKDPNDPKHKEYKQKYITLSIEQNEMYKRMRELTDIRLDRYIMTDEPHIKKSSDKYTEPPTKEKKEKKEKKKEEN